VPHSCHAKAKPRRTHSHLCAAGIVDDLRTHGLQQAVKCPPKQSVIIGVMFTAVVFEMPYSKDVQVAELINRFCDLTKHFDALERRHPIDKFAKQLSRIRRPI